MLELSHLSNSRFGVLWIPKCGTCVSDIQIRCCSFPPAVLTRVHCSLVVLGISKLAFRFLVSVSFEMISTVSRIPDTRKPASLETNEY
jgi:hypothetical protein